MAKVKMYHPQYVNGVVANLTGVGAEVAATAHQIGSRARARLAAHRAEGMAEIEVNTDLPGKYGHIDAEVDLVDHGKQIAAAAIEFGHEQVVFGHRTGKFTPGLYIVTGAAGLF